MMSKRKKSAAGMIAGTILAIQKGFAGWMGRKMVGFGRGGKIGLLVIVCVVFGGLSAASLIRVFTGSDDGKAWQPAKVRVPGHFDKTSDAPANENSIIPPSAYMKMRSFRRYMDSLRQSKTGRSTYDSIMKARPGLMDSVLLLEELYNQQQNNGYGK